MYFINKDNRCFWSGLFLGFGILFLVLAIICFFNFTKETNSMYIFLILFILFIIISIVLFIIWVYISQIWKESNKLKEIIDERITKKYDIVMNENK